MISTPAIQAMEFGMNALLLQAQQMVRNRRHRIEPNDMSDKEFKKQFRFSKVNVQRIADLLDLERENNNGNPLTPFQQVCIALLSYAGHPFQRINGLACGVSQGSTLKVQCTMSLSVSLISFYNFVKSTSNSLICP